MSASLRISQGGPGWAPAQLLMQEAVVRVLLGCYFLGLAFFVCLRAFMIEQVFKRPVLPDICTSSAEACRDGELISTTVGGPVVGAR